MRFKGIERKKILSSGIQVRIRGSLVSRMIHGVRPLLSFTSMIGFTKTSVLNEKY